MEIDLVRVIIIILFIGIVYYVLKKGIIVKKNIDCDICKKNGKHCHALPRLCIENNGNSCDLCNKHNDGKHFHFFNF